MRGPYKFHDQPEHLEHVLNDVNEELWSTKHGLSYGATSMLRFLATIAWTSKAEHPDWYATINPKFARCKAMAQMTGASESSVKRYLKELEDKDFIRREHQYGADGFRKEDRIWLRWTDEDRKLRASDVSDIFRLFEPDRAAGGTAPRYDNRYWIAPSGQFWRFDNKDRKRGDNEEMVTLSSEESVFFWAKDAGWNMTMRRKMMLQLRYPGGHARLRKMMADYSRKSRLRDAS